MTSYLCSGRPVKSLPDWTVGCTVEVMEHECAGRPFVLEFVDVGCHKRYELSRSVFYRNVTGVVLVYDMSNTVSYKNLRKWVRELRRADAERPGGITEKVTRSRRELTGFVRRRGAGGGAYGVSSTGTGSSGGVAADSGAGAGAGPGAGAGAGPGAGPGVGSGAGSAALGPLLSPPTDAMGRGRAAGAVSSSTLSGLSSVPAIVIGNKADLATRSTRARISRMVGLDVPSIEVVSGVVALCPIGSRCVAAAVDVAGPCYTQSATHGTVSDWGTLSTFFDEVIAMRYGVGPRGGSGGGGTPASASGTPGSTTSVTYRGHTMASAGSQLGRARAALFS